MTRVKLRIKEFKDSKGKIVGTSTLSVETDKIWNGWNSIEGLKTKAKPARQAALKKWGYSDTDIAKLKSAGVDV